MHPDHEKQHPAGADPGFLKGGGGGWGKVNCSSDDHTHPTPAMPCPFWSHDMPHGKKNNGYANETDPLSFSE